jgi:amino acid permease
LTGAELFAISRLFNFHFDPKNLEHAGYPESTLQWPTYGTNAAVWVGLFSIVFLAANMLPVRLFGQIEYVMGCIKMIMFVVLILLNVIISSQQPVPRPSHFWTYETPYSGASQNITLPDGHSVLTGGAGKLGAMWEAMTTAMFGMIGFETVSLTAAENKNLRKEETVKLSTRKIALRIILLYCLATFVVGLNVPFTDENIRDTSIIGVINGQNSAFVVATMLNHYRIWPHFINAFFVFSVISCGINTLYNASRVLHALASVEAAWPDWAPVQSIRSRLERTKGGVPVGAVIASWLLSFIAFSASDPGSTKVRCDILCQILRQR